ncbi:MAG: ATP-dependent DNA helicase RecG [Gemmatimonadetes bacterium]|nr:ATP-dependent DNA helicase RecG [Gemmatimonadota bacterium]
MASSRACSPTTDGSRLTFSALDRPVQFLKGVGPRRAEALARMGILTARDLLYHLPRRYDDASTVQKIGRLDVGMEATVVGRVRTRGTVPTRSGLRIFQAVLQDDTGMITCAWPGQPWLDRRIQDGDLLLATGIVRFFHGRQLQPREFTLLARAGEGEGETDSGTIFVSYPASEEMPQWTLRRLFQDNLAALLPLADEDEHLSTRDREALDLPPLSEALRALHRPQSVAEAERGRRRLAYDELFFLQLVQARARWQQTLARPGITHTRTNAHIRPLLDALPFELTGAQARVLREIVADMTSSRRMNRLLQGDVGSGKTIVAVFAMLVAAEGGWQSALMAPTELLTEQHARRLREWLAPLGVRMALLTGSTPAAERRKTLAGLAAGDIPIAVGTHALIQEGVEFHKLGLVVVDEQHRFGVRQRMALGERATNPDVLVMSATPIPRSLALALYGDLDLSLLDEQPAGRQPIRTRLCSPAERDQVYAFVDQQLAQGRQAYFVYPLVEDSEKVDLRSATEEHARLARDAFPKRRLALLHGQMRGEDKEAVMRAFLAGALDAIVATSVIEVGIDVGNATIMVVEHAERFGLSQLHQLRGRVGRGAEESHCVLIAEPGELAGERLKIFRDTTDGFALARADLGIRGQGDLFGAQQHGKDPVLRHADLLRDEALLAEAQRRARAIIDVDPRIEQPAHERARSVLEGRYAERLRMFAVG